MSMTKDEAIRWFNDTKAGGLMLGDKKVVEASEMAIAAIREQEEHRWIPVTERLPEDLCPVLVSLKGLKKAFVGRYQDSEWWSGGADSRPFMLEVTHWMPLPETVKEGA